MKHIFIFCLFALAGCHHANLPDPLSLIQIQDRNGLTETVSNPDRITAYEKIDFLTSQPYKKVLRVYKLGGKNHSKITTYHANGMLSQYLEAKEMRAHGAYREWYPNGQIRIEANVIGGTADVTGGAQRDWLFEGASQVWDEMGNLIALIPYEKGVLNGTSIYYYPSGQTEREVPFIDDQIVGEVVEFFSEGTLKSKSKYQKGVRWGETLRFFETGKLASIEEYTDGRLLSGSYYDAQGDLVSEVQNGGGFQAIFEMGLLTTIEHKMGEPEGVIQKFSKSREPHRIFHIRNGNKSGEEVEFYLSSEVEIPTTKPIPKMSVNWSGNTIQGCAKTWYPNGNLQSQREYTRNVRSGPSLAWYRDGSFMMVEEYAEDRLISGQYFKLNKSEPVSSIVNGNGVATLFDEFGTFLRKVVYQKGKPVEPEN